MSNAQRLKILTNSGRTVFSAKNLQSLWHDNSSTAKVAAKRMAQKGFIIRIAKGYYALSLDKRVALSYELANLIVSPSYISLNTALFYHGLSFQVSNTISSVALFNYQKKINRKNG